MVVAARASGSESNHAAAAGILLSLPQKFNEGIFLGRKQ